MPVWQSSPVEFVSRLKILHGNVAIDWGFPIACLHIVQAFRDAGVRLVWFQGNIKHAREFFLERGGIDPRAFDIQVAKIEQSGLPAGLEATLVDALTPGGSVRSMKAIYKQIF